MFNDVMILDSITVNQLFRSSQQLINKLTCDHGLRDKQMGYIDRLLKVENEWVFLLK